MVLALVILLPALYGFGTKFRELVVLVGDEEGSFTVVPILNYLMVTLGFLMLFGWALMHGMFRDIEGPKITMLENERRLEEQRQRELEEAAEHEHSWEGELR
jgi:hypothetical protein